MVQGREEFKQRASLSVVLEKAEFDAFEEIRWRERMSRSEIGRKAIQEYVKNHGEGNSTFKLDQFQDPDFKAMPAFMTPMMKWTKFIDECVDTIKECKDIELKGKSIAGVAIRKAQKLVSENK